MDSRYIPIILFGLFLLVSSPNVSSASITRTCPSGALGDSFFGTINATNVTDYTNESACLFECIDTNMTLYIDGVIQIANVSGGTGEWEANATQLMKCTGEDITMFNRYNVVGWFSSPTLRPPDEGISRVRCWGGAGQLFLGTPAFPEFQNAWASGYSDWSRFEDALPYFAQAEGWPPEAPIPTFCEEQNDFNVTSWSCPTGAICQVRACGGANVVLESAGIPPTVIEEVTSGCTAWHSISGGGNAFAQEWVDVDVIVPIGATIVDKTFPSTAFLDQVITVKVFVKNTGGFATDFYVGLTIGELSPPGVYCNRDCYTDGLGDYFVINDLAVNDTVVATRTFRLRNDFFDTNKSYDVAIGVYEAPGLPPSEALDYELDTNVITIPAPTPFAVPINATTTRTTTSLKDTLDITAYILNNGTVTHEFTLGMSIGLWNVTSGAVFSEPQPYLLPPCNVECYRDEIGDWEFLFIPPNFTALFTRRFFVPEYFLENEGIDVAVGVWSKPPEEGGEPISWVVFKNISFVSPTPRPEVAIGEALSGGIGFGVDILSEGFGTDVEGGKFLLWGFLTLAVAGGITYFTSKSNPAWQLGIVGSLVMMLLGASIGFVPAWIAIIFVVISGFLLANWVRGIVSPF